MYTRVYRRLKEINYVFYRGTYNIIISFMSTNNIYNKMFINKIKGD